MCFCWRWTYHKSLEYVTDLKFCEKSANENLLSTSSNNQGIDAYGARSAALYAGAREFS